MADIRVSDADRAQVADRLARAQAEGRLALGEFDERVRAAYAAVVRTDLEPLTADLPASPPPVPDVVAISRPVAPGPGGDPARRRPGTGLRGATGVWAAVSAINLAIWAVVVLAASGPVYPWWIWVAGPWGAVLAMRALAGRGVVPGRSGAPGAPPCGMRPGR